MEQINEAIQNIQTKITSDSVFLFDMDGTLVDTNFANFLSYKKAIQSITRLNVDIPFNPEERFDRNILKTIVPALSEVEYEKIVQKKEEFFNDHLNETKLNQIISDILYKYSKTNKTFLVSNCREERAIATLSHFGLVEKFSKIFFRQPADHDKKFNKFQCAISKLGVPPDLVVVFENEEKEIANARQAGVTIINPKIDLK